MLQKCPVCLNKHSTKAKIREYGVHFRVDCLVCGDFTVSKEVWEDWLDPASHGGRELTELYRARLSHKLRTGSTRNSYPVPHLDSDFVDSFIRAGCRGPNPSEQATNIIRYVGDEVSRSGAPINDLPLDFYATIGAPNPKFAAELAFELLKKGILCTSKEKALIDTNLTWDGWNQYESEKRGQLAGKYGFIAMEFGDDVLDPFVENTVKPAVKEGIDYDLVDMRSVARAGIIDNLMRSQIRDAAFVIVDLTHDNSGAYWEAGYAEGLGKPVIYICQKDKFEEAQTHFDTNHCTTVLWSQKAEDEFQQQLVATLRRSLNLFSKAS